jgi:hypothetical protein
MSAVMDITYSKESDITIGVSRELTGFAFIIFCFANITAHQSSTGCQTRGLNKLSARYIFIDILFHAS